MKHGNHHGRAKNGEPRLESVRFEYRHPGARTVCVAGSFNDWVPDAKSMHHMGEGRWIKDTALAPGTYEYCLIVDGEWMTDPAAQSTVRNPFGGYNSVLTVTATPEPPREGGADGGRSAGARK